MNEYLLSTNKYNRPTVLKDKDTVNLLLIRLLLLTPGSMPLHPNMGVGLVSKWRYSDMSRIDELQAEVENQISTYLPMLLPARVEIKENQEVDNEIIIDITVDNVVYSYTTDNGTIKLSELQ